jgi:[protein-PII] uridylyltransferase
MWLLAEHSKSERPLHPKAVRSLDAGFQRTPDAKWADELRQAFLELLDGPGVESALRHLDHACALIQLLPEWKRVRALAQHDPYHRYTVDGHSFKAVAEVKKVIAEDPLARRAAEEAGPITTLLIAALLHDIGKGPKPAGGPADHSELGAGLAAEAARRMGCDAQEVAEIEILVRHHLSLVDTATRRDLGDGDVIRSVAENVGSPRALRLLFILTQADARATGPEAWGSWKAALVTELYRKALVAIETGHIPPRTAVAQRLRELAAYDPLAAAIAEDMAGTLPASYLESPVDVLAEELRMLKMAPPDSEILTRIEPGKETEITVCLSDRPGILARSAGVVALHRLDVLRARTYSTTTGVALQRFTVRAGSGGAPDWTVFENDLRRAFSGRLPLEAEVERKVSDYRPSEPLDVEVRALQAESAHSTVLEVRSRDALGVLYSIAQALAHLDIDIHVAKVDTLGERIVDAFYVRSIDGKKLDEDQVRSAIAAITHRIGKLFG